jgi:hypothetical protein
MSAPDEKREYVASVSAAAWPLRLPVIRHVRWVIATYRVNQITRFICNSGNCRSGRT